MLLNEMPKLKLRDYQEKGVNLIRKALTDNKKKVLLFMATGGGKGVIFVDLVKRALSKNKKVCLVMRRRQIVFQARDRFKKFGIDSSLMISSSKGFDRDHPFQICSIDTVTKRNTDFLKTFDLVICDEAHDCTSPTYQKFFNIFVEKTIFVGLTATPFLNGKKAHTFWDACVKPIEVHELMEQDFLVPCALYVPHEIDLSDVKISSTGDYKNDQLGQKMSKMEIIGNIIDDYVKIGKGKPAICFCVNKEHSRFLCLEFNKNFIPAKHADESTPQKERDEILKEFREGKIQVICNVNIFSTGVDLPEIEVAIMARPTRSEILWIQQVGRALRPCRKCGKCNSQYDNSPQCPVCGFDKPSYIKEKAIVIDSGNNTSRHGHPYDVRYPVMDEKDKKARKERVLPITKTCKFCYYVYDANLDLCPMCKQEMELPETLFKTKDGVIVPYDEFTVISDYFDTLVRAEANYNWKPLAKCFKLCERFGPKVMKYKKQFNIPSWVPQIIQKEKEQQLKGKLYT